MDIFITHPSQIDSQLDMLKEMLRQAMVPDATGQVVKMHVSAQPQESAPATVSQRNAIQLYCGRMAMALNDSGQDMRAVLSAETDIPWTKDSFRANVWNRVAEAMFPGVDSTTKLDKKQASEVYEAVNRMIATRAGLSLPFPCKGERL